MKDEEIDLLKKTSSSVAHCPTSNMCLSSGLCPIRRLLKSGVKVGLGTDVSGGYSSSILEAMRHAFMMSKCVNMAQTDLKPLSYGELFYLATLGGAQALNIDKEVGNFEVGKEFDALHIDLASVSSPIDLITGEDLMQMVQKFIMLGDDRNIVQVYVQGKKIKSPVRPVFLV
jgi:guanine deaminase